MRLGWFVLALALLARNANGADITVCLATTGSVLTFGATGTVSATFEKVGVTVDWRCPKTLGPGASGVVLRVELVDGDPPEHNPGALGVSYPRAGCSKAITVYYKPIRSLAGGPNDESTLLAYVLAHEITHVIQGVSRHSPSGVMKARWSEQDRAAIASRQLGFDDLDVRLIRDGLAAGVCRGDARVTGRSERGSAVRQE